MDINIPSRFTGPGHGVKVCTTATVNCKRYVRQHLLFVAPSKRLSLLRFVPTAPETSRARVLFPDVCADDVAHTQPHRLHLVDRDESVRPVEFGNDITRCSAGAGRRCSLQLRGAAGPWEKSPSGVDEWSNSCYNILQITDRNS